MRKSHEPWLREKAKATLEIVCKQCGRLRGRESFLSFDLKKCQTQGVLCVECRVQQLDGLNSKGRKPAPGRITVFLVRKVACTCVCVVQFVAVCASGPASVFCVACICADVSGSVRLRRHRKWKTLNAFCGQDSVTWSLVSQR